jgi:hypothetical protein
MPWLLVWPPARRRYSITAQCASGVAYTTADLADRREAETVSTSAAQTRIVGVGYGDPQQNGVDEHLVVGCGPRVPSGQKPVQVRFHGGTGIPGS